MLIDNNKNPLVSIGLPAYNGAQYIREAVDSLLAQDYDHFELIISDNCSNDGTWEILKEYSLKDHRIKLSQNEKNMGANYNFIRVHELSKGKYFMWAAHDDKWEPSYIRECVLKLEENPNAILCSTDIYFIDENNKPLTNHYWSTYKLNDLSMENIDERIINYWGRGYSHPMNHYIYGLYRYEIIKQLNFDITCYGNDVVIMFEATLLGLFEKVPHTLNYYRIAINNTIDDMLIKVYGDNIIFPMTDLFKNLIKMICKSSFNLIKKIKIFKTFFKAIFIESSWFKTEHYRYDVNRYLSSKLKRDYKSIFHRKDLLVYYIILRIVIRFIKRYK